MRRVWDSNPRSRLKDVSLAVRCFRPLSQLSVCLLRCYYLLASCSTSRPPIVCSAKPHNDNSAHVVRRPDEKQNYLLFIHSANSPCVFRQIKAYYILFYFSRGKTTSTLVPSSALLMKITVPWWSSIIFFTVNNPIPVPGI